MLIHEIVRDTRIARGLSVPELARLAQVDDGNLYRFERGDKWMREPALQRVLAALDLKLVKASEHVPSPADNVSDASSEDSEPQPTPFEDQTTEPMARAVSVS